MAQHDFLCSSCRTHKHVRYKYTLASGRLVCTFCKSKIERITKENTLPKVYATIDNETVSVRRTIEDHQDYLMDKDLDPLRELYDE